jgi:hypothetical protein
VPRCRRSIISAANLSFACAVTVALALVLTPASAGAQAQNSDDLLQPSLDGNPAAAPVFTPGNAPPPAQAPPAQKFTAPSRIGATPVYGSPTGFGAGDTGFDSSNTRRRTQLPGVSNNVLAPPQAETTFDPVPAAPPQLPSQPPVLAPPPKPEVYPARAASRPGAVLPPPPDQIPISNPPAVVYPATAANRPGAVLAVPQIDFGLPASTPPPGTPPLNTLPLGTVPQHTLPMAGGDPYEALGIKAGSFLILPAVELSAGYDNNPQHIPGGPGSGYYVVAPELHAQSQWSANSLTADITGSYTAYGNDSFQPSLDHPYLNAKIDGRLDVTRDTQILLETRAIVATDNPGSPNLQAGLAKLPVDMTGGATVGIAQQFGRFDVSLKGTFDRSIYDNSQLTDGEVVSNDDRAFDQWGGILRAGYDIDPGFKPFVEVDADTRIHDEKFDSEGLQRDSTGTSAKIGGAFDVLGSLTGEIAVGYMERTYQDPTLPNIGGMTLDGSLLWQASALTSAKLTASSTVGESTVPGVSGAFSRDINLQIDHAFLRWLIGTAQVGYGNDDYVGLDRSDNRYYASLGLTYKLNRDMQIKGTVREDWLTSNVGGVAYHATSALLTLRLQR